MFRVSCVRAYAEEAGRPGVLVGQGGHMCGSLLWTQEGPGEGGSQQEAGVLMLQRAASKVRRRMQGVGKTELASSKLGERRRRLGGPWAGGGVPRASLWVAGGW